jgi:plastocyanin domain-containing protein
MTPKRLLTLTAAVAALSASPALAADHDMHHPTPSPAALTIAEGTLKNGVRTVEVSVTNEGFVPARIKVNKGEKLRLVVTRKTDKTCATEIVVKGHGIDKKLPLNKPVTVELTPTKSGEIRYACAMDMIAGVIFVP